MPVYEFYCNKDNSIFEVIGSYEKVGKEQNCPNCGYICPKIPSRVSMQPDTFWSGVVAPNVDKYFTSKTAYKNYLTENGKIIVEAGMESWSPEKRAKVVSEKNDKVRKEIIADIVKNNVPLDAVENNSVNFVTNNGEVI